jgi:hypothetical protein
MATLTGPVDLECSDVPLSMSLVNHIYYEGNLPVIELKFGVAAAPLIISECTVRHGPYKSTPTLRTPGYH